MSPSAEREGRRDDGFTLVEVIVALGITTLVMVALLPQLVVGLRSTGTATTVTTAKGVVQSELERMRNLPFHVAPAAGAYVDVLDRYYPHLRPPTNAPACAAPDAVSPASWSGFVAPTSTARCSFEPATGAFYRTVRTVTTTRGPMVLVVATQFLTGSTPPTAVTPRTGYDAAVNGKNLPASSQLGVTATVAHGSGGVVRPVTTHTQLADQPSSPTRLKAEARAAALHVGSVTADGRALSLTAGLVNAAGSVGNASTVTGNATAVTAGLATGEQGAGATSTVQAPPSQTVAPASSPAGGLPVLGCSFACWSPSRLGSTTVSAESGLPVAGTSATPLQAGIVDTSTNTGVQLGTSTTTDGYRAALDLTGPLVRLDDSDAPLPSQLTGCAVTPTGVVTASGFLRATEGAAAMVESCAVARSTAVSLFPTGFAPRGVIRVRLEHASAGCTATGSTGQATHDYRAVVEVWDGAAFAVVAEVVGGQAVDPLAAVALTTPVGGGHVLGDYLASWSAATTGTVRTSQSAGAAEVSVPGVVAIATQPVRADAAAPDGLDPASAVSLTLGAVSCSAEDAR